MTTFGLYSIKGGVGKTAAAVNLARLAAADGQRTLLYDLDPQGSSTFYFRIQQGLPVSTKRLLKGKSDLEDLIKPTEYANLDLLPSDMAFRKLDLVLQRLKRSRKRLQEMLEPLEGSYRWVFLDCPPSISIVSESVFRAVDILLVPLIPSTLSLRTYGELVGFFEQKGLNTSVILPFFSMVERRKKLHRECMEKLAGGLDRLCRSYIPYLSDVERMGVRMKPVVEFRPSSPASEAFRNLWDEIRDAGRTTAFL
jgi:cellulose biosynthesis protein BcsQ